MTFSDTIGNKVKDYRKHNLRLTQKELAEKLNVSRITINRLENGHNISKKLMNKLYEMGFE